MSRPVDPLPSNARAFDEHGVVVRGAEPAQATTVLRHMVYGSGLTRSLDYVVLLHALFRLEENQAFTPRDIWKDLQNEGIRSAKNINELVGRDAVYQSFNRLIEARFLRRVEVDGAPGKFGKVRYELFRVPSYNPDTLRPDQSAGADGAAASAPLPGTPEADKPNDKTAGQPASRNPGYGVPASGVPGSGRRRVSAGQPTSQVPGSGNVAPPTPPHWEEEDSSSLKSSSTAPAVPAGAQTTDAAAVTAAAEFLAELPGRWACGRKTAADLAPLLAEAVREQGWQLDEDLVQQLTRRSQARRSVQSVLKERIEDLPRHRAVRKALEQERARLAGAREDGGQQLALGDERHGRADEVRLPEGVTPERVEQARVFLLTLSGPWALGPEDAARLAPKLAVKTAERGWDFDAKLLAQLQSNPGGVNNYVLVLERQRIGGLPFRRSPVGEQRRESRDARQQAIDDCSVCDAYGQFQQDNGAAVLCRHEKRPGAPALVPSPVPDEREQREALGKPQRKLADLLVSMRKSAV